MYGVDSKDSVPADFPKKNSGLAPEGLSILAGTGAGHRPLWCPTMALKIKIIRGPGGSPWRFFSPFLCVKKGGGPQARPVFAGRVGVCPRI